jgi:hypothetical protein
MAACSAEPLVNTPADGGSHPSDGGDQPSDGGDQPGDGGTLPPAEYCEVYRLACQRQLECGVGVVNHEATQEACELTAACEARLADLKSAGQVVRPDDTASCFDALKHASCTTLANQRLGVSPACASLHGGTKKVNESCGGGVVNDCEPGLICDTSATCPGVCRAPESSCTEGSCAAGSFCSSFGDCRPKATANQTCDYVPFEAITENSCADGLFCNFEMKCVARLAENAACNGGTFFECRSGLACIEGTCQSARQLEQECNSADMCATGLYCDFQSGHCETRGAKGATCSNSAGSCAAGLSCALADGSETGVCQPIGNGSTPPDNRPIGELNGDCSSAVCPLGTRCECTEANCAEQRCQAAPKLGQSCAVEGSFDVDPLTCAEGICDLMGSRTCVRPQAVGASCSALTPMTAACVSGFCSFGQCASSSVSACEE